MITAASSSAGGCPPEAEDATRDRLPSDRAPADHSQLGSWCGAAPPLAVGRGVPGCAGASVAGAWRVTPNGCIETAFRRAWRSEWLG